MWYDLSGIAAQFSLKNARYTDLLLTERKKNKNVTNTGSSNLFTFEIKLSKFEHL